MAFVPYSELAKGALEGTFQLVKNLAADIGDGEVELKSADRVKFEYLAIATGIQRNLPAQVRSMEKENGCMELREMQKMIKDAGSLAMVGGRSGWCATCCRY